MKLKCKIVDWWSPKCEHSENCTSKGNKCSSCKHNKKKDHYKRDDPLNWWTTPNPFMYEGPAFNAINFTPGQYITVQWTTSP